MDGLGWGFAAPKAPKRDFISKKDLVVAASQTMREPEIRVKMLRF